MRSLSDEPWCGDHDTLQPRAGRGRPASRLRKNHFGTVELRWPARLGQKENSLQAVSQTEWDVSETARAKGNRMEGLGLLGLLAVVVGLVGLFVLYKGWHKPQ